MPTYVCSVPPGLLRDEQKLAIAKAIGTRHAQVTGAPTSFVQVVIEENATKARYLGGTPADAHVWVRGDIRSGRSVDQREELMLGIVADIEQIAAIPRRDIWVYLCNLEPTDMVEYGRVLPKAGEEQGWLDDLPPDLRAYMSSLGIEKEKFTL